MGMFDWYLPAGLICCPIDGYPLEEWQGKRGPCLLFLWQEGFKHPVDHLVDEEVRFRPHRWEEFVLPPTFEIYSYDCPIHQPVDAVCTTRDGVWISTEMRELESKRGKRRG